MLKMVAGMYEDRCTDNLPDSYRDFVEERTKWKTVVTDLEDSLMDHRFSMVYSEVKKHANYRNKEQINNICEWNNIYMYGSLDLYNQFIDEADEIQLYIYKGSGKTIDNDFPAFELFFNEINSEEKDDGIIITYKKIWN